MSTCKDCIHKKACFGPDEVDDKGSIFMLSNAEKDCVSFEHIDNFQPGGALFPLNMRLYDKYYSKPRCWKIRAIDISIVRDKPRVALFIRCTSHASSPRTISIDLIGKQYFYDEKFESPETPLEVKYPMMP